MIRLMIADDHAIVRSGLKQIIATTIDIAVVAEATRGEEIFEQLQKEAVDLLLLDMSMPGLAGLELIGRLQVAHARLPILVLSMHNEGQIVARALRAGAGGYVTKDSEPEVLLAAIRKVTHGGRFIDPALGDVLVFDHGPARPLAHEVLSERERQVLEGIVAGLPLGEIADQLHLSPKTVSTHKMRLMEKLQVDNNADLIRYAIRHGLTVD
ncbi:MAG: response regulator transcription factor [Proteobacteria bacterium]|nr:response regulator transcription factor [Pseudomonadota bacterium]